MNEDLTSLLDDVQILIRDKQFPILASPGEKSPVDFDFIYSPSSSPSKIAPEKKLPSAVRPENAEPNAVCTLCSGRLYPVKVYRREGRLPVLFLLYNGSFGSVKRRTDRSRTYVFGSAEEDDLFSRMTARAGFRADDFFFQEFTACHFNPERSSPGDWEDRASNCRRHLLDTVKANNIKYLVAAGPAAILLLGEENARSLSQTSGEMEADLGEIKLPCAVIRSPQALLSIEARRQKLKEGEKYTELLEEEKKIKRSILDTLEKIRQRI